MECVKKENGEIIARTSWPFEWFPELEKIFENFNIKRMSFELKDGETSFDIIDDNV